MARRKSDATRHNSDINMGDAGEWRTTIARDYNCRVRIVWTVGASDRTWRVDIQAVQLGAGQQTVIGATWSDYPNRRYSSAESLMLNLLMRLDSILLEKTGGLRQATFAA